VRRVSVVGVPGSGKSTLGPELAARLGVRYAELDAIFHQPGWTPLDGGQFNLGVADVILIAAISEHLRRRNVRLALAVLPGVIGLGLGEALVASLPEAPPALVGALVQSVIPFLTAGYVLTELAISQTSPAGSSSPRGRHSSRSGSPSPARRCHPGCSRASSCSERRSRCAGSVLSPVAKLSR